MFKCMKNVYFGNNTIMSKLEKKNKEGRKEKGYKAPPNRLLVTKRLSKPASNRSEIIDHVPVAPCRTT